MPKAVPQPEREEIIAAVKAGESSGEIARRFHRSKSTVWYIATEAGLSFERSEPKRATEARRADNAFRRTELARLLLDDIEWIRGRFRQPHRIVGFSGGEALFVNVDEAPAGDLRNYMAALGIAVDKHLALERHDGDDQGLAAVDAWLRSVTRPA